MVRRLFGFLRTKNEKKQDLKQEKIQSNVSEETVKNVTQNKIDNKKNKNVFFYNEDEIIKEIYRGLKTPSTISSYYYDNMAFLRSNERIKVVKLGVSTLSYGISSHEEFLRDSIKYATKYKTMADNVQFVPLKCYYTTFENLNTSQLNWYLFWRNCCLNGEYIDTDLSYIFLFAYELLNYSFNQNAAFNISMMDILKHKFSHLGNSLERYLDSWMRDLLYEVEGGKEIVEEFLEPMANDLFILMREANTNLEKISISYWHKNFPDLYNCLRYTKEEKLMISNADSKYKNKFKIYIGRALSKYRDNGVELGDNFFTLEFKNVENMFYNPYSSEYYSYNSPLFSGAVSCIERRNRLTVPKIKMYTPNSEFTHLVRQVCILVFEDLFGKKLDKNEKCDLSTDLINYIRVSNLKKTNMVNDKKLDNSLEININDLFCFVIENGTRIGESFREEFKILIKRLINEADITIEFIRNRFMLNDKDFATLNINIEHEKINVQKYEEVDKTVLEVKEQLRYSFDETVFFSIFDEEGIASVDKIRTYARQNRMFESKLVNDINKKYYPIEQIEIIKLNGDNYKLEFNKNLIERK